MGGYYPTPTDLLPLIAALVTPTPGPHKDAVADPCAGKGEALAALARAWFPSDGLFHRSATIYAAELEGTRYKAADRLLCGLGLMLNVKCVHADALRLDLTTGKREAPGLSALYLNPPYDTDRAPFRRLEERFLQRFLPALLPEGVLLYVIPITALAASAETLATLTDRVEVLRFPDGEYEAFRQVVVRAVRRLNPLPGPSAKVLERLRLAVQDPMTLPVLGAGEVKPYPMPVPPTREDWQRKLLPGEAGVAWKARLLDEDVLFDATRGWHQTARGGALEPPARVFPASSMATLRARYPMAVPPKPAHIAAAIAAGVFNGETMVPDAADSASPPMVVKGKFARKWRTVEEKRNQDNEVTGHVQVEEPRLEVTVLDLRKVALANLKSSPVASGSADPAKMTVGDLLTQYGHNLLTTLRAHCPVVHDPGDSGGVIPLDQTARPLYAAQAHAAMALVKLLGGHRVSRRRRRGCFGYLIGEVGSGKSGTFLVVGRSIGARRTLVVCPPHLLASWEDEARSVWPEARTVTLSSVQDVDALAAEALAQRGQPGFAQPVVALLSREAAKLGHGWASVARCGGCGALSGTGDHAERRSTCTHHLPAPSNPAETFSQAVRERLRGHIPSLPGRPRCTPHTAMRQCLELALNARLWSTATLLGEGLASPEARLEVVRAVPLQAEESGALQLLLTVPHETPGWDVEVARRLPDQKVIRVFRAWSRHFHERTSRPDHWCPYGRLEMRAALTVEGRVVGTTDSMGAVLATLAKVPSRVCGEPLYSAIPSPRRTSLAAYIAHRHPKLFDLLGLDEAHELSGEGSAQERAAHRLTGTRTPTVLLTGSILNGYAAHLFPHLWALNPAFRERYKREERGKFAKQNGYRRRFVEAKDDTSKSRRGKVTDRVEGGRDMGEAPGIQPTAVLQWLLPHAVTLHKADLDVDIPPLTMERVLIQPTEEMMVRHKAMLTDLLRQVKADRFSELQGALWGQLTMAPSHLDRMTADVCQGDGAYEIRYPEERGGQLVHRGEVFPADTVLPKEQWMLDEIAAELALDRPCIVLSHHVELMPRYARLIREKLGVKVAMLDAGKVPPAKRQAWIKRQNADGVRVLLTNPVAIATGLNVLVYYCTELWMENPGCNALVFRQATGRIDRIGQTRPTKVKFPVYAGTIQEPAHKLLLQKVAVSQSTDGLDARSALQAAGVGEPADVSALSVGKLLFELLDKSDGLRDAMVRRDRAPRLAMA